jgi:DNA-directed RNA polymerase specialized sigma24 family protein
MFGRKKRIGREFGSEFATAHDFQQIFSDDMAGLHLLAWLLTADEQKAEQVFVAGLEDSIKGNPVFRQWARSWSQRAIIKRAIRAVVPSPGDPALTAPPMQGHTGNRELNILVSAVAKLAPFERFVFVLSVLEGYSISECATLLSSTLSDVVSAKSKALHLTALAQDGQPTLSENSAAVAAPWKMLFQSPTRFESLRVE